MSSKHSRHTPSPAPNSKLPKFLQKSRDRSKSVNEGAISSPELPTPPSPSYSHKSSRKSSKILEEPPEETPVIVEPVQIPSPRQRTRSDRPQSSEIPQTYPSSTSPTSRMGDFPTRLSGWFSHTFSTSSTDLSLPNLLAQTSSSNSVSTGSSSSPRNRLGGASALLTAAKHGKGHLDKAMRYLLDSDATPDKCTDPIWILGVQHPGYEPPPPVQPQPPPSAFSNVGGTLGRRGSVTSSNSSDQSHGHKRSRSRGHHAHSSSISSPSNSHFLSQSQPASSSPSQSQSLSSSTSSSTATPSSSSSITFNPATSTSSTQSQSQSLSSKDPKPGAGAGAGASWPPVFYADFTSRVWLTYRSHFPPIRDGSLQELTPPACEPLMATDTDTPTPASPSTFSSLSTNSAFSNNSATSATESYRYGHRTSSRYTDSYKSDSSHSTGTGASHNSNRGPGSPSSVAPNTNPNTNPNSSSSSRKWNWTVGGLGGEKGWTSDSGWGCMLRTGQSLLANALVFMHLGREWRKPPYPEMTREYATYVQIVTWFLDTPDERAPFSVHRMALAGKDLGKDVGMWFGPSTAAGAIKFLVQSYPDCGLGVSVATDGVLTQTDVYAASHGSSGSYPHPHSSRRGKGAVHTSWGDRPVLVLFGIRLGLDGVNPIYHDTIKMLYTFPQSVGIAGGRPSSSYYFVGSQSDNLFYLDPHHARPAVPLRPPPNFIGGGGGTGAGPHLISRQSGSSSGHGNDTTDYAGDERDEKERGGKKKSMKKPKRQARSSSGGSGGSGGGSSMPGSPSSTRTGSSFHVPLAPSPLQQQYSRSSPSGSSRNGASGSGSASPSQPPSRTESPEASGDMDYSELVGPSSHGLTPLEEHYATAYSAAELKTFHCDRIRKMPLSGLDPSMLIAFLCRDEKDWVDFRRRVGELPKTIFSIQDEAPSWAADSADNMGLESMSDPDDEMDMELGDGEEEDPSMDASVDSRSRSASLSLDGSSTGGARSRSEELDTEEDPVDPITPGPSSTRFEVPVPKGSEGHEKEKIFDDGDDIEDDWVDPSVPSTPMETPSPTQPFDNAPVAVVPPAMKKTRTSSSGSKKKKTKKQVPVPVPKVRLPSPPVPFPVATEDVSAEGPISTSYSSSSSMSGAGEDSVGASIREKRMHNARARDGGRTQSGGVKGVLTDDWVDGH